MFYVFFGERRDTAHTPHESPAVMTVPLIVLAAGTVLLSLIGTPAWPWFHSYLSGHAAHVQPVNTGVLAVMLLSTALVALGITAGWWLYGRSRIANVEAPDALETLQPDIFTVLRNKFWIDDLYDKSIVRLNRGLSRASNWLDTMIWGGAVTLLSYLFLGIAWLNRFFDEYVVNLGFDKGCGSVRWSARFISFFQNGQVQRYLRALGFGVALLVIIFIWGCRP